MKSSLNRFNGGYIGDGRLYDFDGNIGINKHYIRHVGTEWIRPSDWLSMPDLSGVTVGTIVGLVALIPGFSAGHTGITSNSNFVSFAGRPAYIVDWGDGTTSSHADLATASKQYNYYAAPESTTTSEGYRQVIVTVRAQTGNLTGFFLNTKPSIAGVTLPNGLACNVLEWVVKNPSLNNTSPLSTSSSRYPLCKAWQFIGSTSLTTTGLFQNMIHLEQIGGSDWSSNLTSFNGLFTSCSSIRTLPLLDTRKMTSAIQIFNGCARLKILPPITTSLNTNFNTALFQCVSLESIPTLITSASTNNLQMHTFNYSLRKIPEYDFSLNTSNDGTFASCFSLKLLPNLNTSNVTNFNSMLSNSYSLRELPAFNTSKVTNFSNFLFNSTRINTIPEYNFSSATTINAVFRDTVSVWKSGTIAGGTGLTGYLNAYQGAGHIVMGISSSVGVTFTSFAAGVFFPPSARVALMTGVGTTQGISYTGTHLSPTALNDVFRGLATVSGGTYNINITGVWGSSGCDRTIATSKGWTVIG